MYRIGWPFWKVFARYGCPVLLRVNVYHDTQSASFWADSPDLDGLIVSGHTLDELRQEVRSATATLLELEINSRAQATPELRFRDTALCPI